MKNGLSLSDFPGFSPRNYTAVSILERLGLSSPSEAQIRLIESLLLMLTRPEKINPKMIKHCIGDDKLAYSFLYLKNKIMVSQRK